jgi:uncharacterized membrane protein
MSVSLTTLVLALAIGIIAGLRAMIAPAAVSWAARLGRLDLSSSWLAFLGYAYTPWILTVFALLELVVDQLPTTPSRTEPRGFTARIVTGALSGAALAAPGGATIIGAICGAIGAVIGTLGGRAVRGQLAKAFGTDQPAAFLEDAAAIGGACLIIVALP